MQLENAFKKARKKAKQDNTIYAVYWANNMEDYWLVDKASEFPAGFYGYKVFPDGSIITT